MFHFKHFDYGDITDGGMATTNMSINSIQIPNSPTSVNKNSLTVKEYYTNIHQYQNEFLQAPTSRQKAGVGPNMNHYPRRWAYLEKDFLDKMRSVKRPAEAPSFTTKDALRSTIREKLISSNLTAATEKFCFVNNVQKSQSSDMRYSMADPNQTDQSQHNLLSGIYAKKPNNHKIPSPVKISQPKKLVARSSGDYIKAHYQKLARQIEGLETNPTIDRQLFSTADNQNAVVQGLTAEMEFSKNLKSLNNDAKRSRLSMGNGFFPLVPVSSHRGEVMAGQAGDSNRKIDPSCLSENPSRKRGLIFTDKQKSHLMKLGLAGSRDYDENIPGKKAGLSMRFLEGKVRFGGQSHKKDAGIIFSNLNDL